MTSGNAVERFTRMQHLSLHILGLEYKKRIPINSLIDICSNAKSVSEIKGSVWKNVWESVFRLRGNYSKSAEASW